MLWMWRCYKTQRGHVQNAVISCSKCSAVMSCSKCSAVMSYSKCSAVLSCSKCSAVMSCSKCSDVMHKMQCSDVMLKMQCSDVMLKTQRGHVQWKRHVQSWLWYWYLLGRVTASTTCISSLRIELCLWIYAIYPHACTAHRNMMLKIQSEMSAWKKSILKPICTGIGFGYGIEIRYISSIFCSNASCSGKSIWPDFRSRRFKSWMDLITKWHGTSHHELDT